MPHSKIVNKQLAALLGVLGHPHRIRIVEILRGGERDVNTLQSALGISHSGTSQHLAIMRTNQVVVERREGRRVLYRLVNPDLANWLEAGFRYLEETASGLEELRHALKIRNEDSSATEAAMRGPELDYQTPERPFSREVRRPKQSTEPNSRKALPAIRSEQQSASQDDNNERSQPF
jgi:DNA-binding transcriptional ArsR family regulator